MSPVKRYVLGSSVVLVLALASAAAVIGFDRYQSRQQLEQRVAWLTGGDARRGPPAIAKYGCGGCHTIPGIEGARGLSGPPLTKFGQRTFVAGQLRNTPGNLTKWLQHPHRVEPGTAMPEMGVTPADARDIAAYLYTLN